MLDPRTIDSDSNTKSSNGLHCLLHKRPFIYLNHTAAVGYLSYRVTRNTDFEAGLPKWTDRKKKSFFFLLWLLRGPLSSGRSGPVVYVCTKGKNFFQPALGSLLSHKVRSIRPSVEVVIPEAVRLGSNGQPLASLGSAKVGARDAGGRQHQRRDKVKPNTAWQVNLGWKLNPELEWRCKHNLRELFGRGDLDGRGKS